MSKDSLFYELSHEADQDIDEIFDYTLVKFGVDQAIIYLSQFDELFEILLNNPELGKSRNEIKQGLRSILQNSHMVYYRILTDRIRIVRILHGSRDQLKFLDYSNKK